MTVRLLFLPFCEQVLEFMDFVQRPDREVISDTLLVLYGGAKSKEGEQHNVMSDLYYKMYVHCTVSN